MCPYSHLPSLAHTTFQLLFGNDFYVFVIDVVLTQEAVNTSVHQVDGCRERRERNIIQSARLLQTASSEPCVLGTACPEHFPPSVTGAPTSRVHPGWVKYPLSPEVSLRAVQEWDTHLSPANSNLWVRTLCFSWASSERKTRAKLHEHLLQVHRHSQQPDWRTRLCYTLNGWQSKRGTAMCCFLSSWLHCCSPRDGWSSTNCYFKIHERRNCWATGTIPGVTFWGAARLWNTYSTETTAFWLQWNNSTITEKQKKQKKFQNPGKGVDGTDIPIESKEKSQENLKIFQEKWKLKPARCGSVHL